MTENPLLPFKNFESERLLLRQMTHEDVNEIFEIRSSPELMKFVPRPLLKNKEEALKLIDMINQKIIDKEGINWAVTIKPSNKLVGYIGHYKIKWEHFRSEIGYMFLPDVQGKGIATEAINLLVEYGFETLKLHSIEAVIDPENIASSIVLEKNGFIKEAHFKENEYYNGKFIDSAVYSIINSKN